MPIERPWLVCYLTWPFSCPTSFVLPFSGYLAWNPYLDRDNGTPRCPTINYHVVLPPDQTKDPISPCQADDSDLYTKNSWRLALPKCVGYIISREIIRHCNKPWQSLPRTHPSFHQTDRRCVGRNWELFGDEQKLPCSKQRSVELITCNIRRCMVLIRQWAAYAFPPH